MAQKARKYVFFQAVCSLTTYLVSFAGDYNWPPNWSWFALRLWQHLHFGGWGKWACGKANQRKVDWNFRREFKEPQRWLCQHFLPACPRLLLRSANKPHFLAERVIRGFTRHFPPGRSQILSIRSSLRTLLLWALPPAGGVYGLRFYSTPADTTLYFSQGKKKQLLLKRSHGSS